jgi:hypothetical protein
MPSDPERLLDFSSDEEANRFLVPFLLSWVGLFPHFDIDDWWEELDHTEIPSGRKPAPPEDELVLKLMYLANFYTIDYRDTLPDPEGPLKDDDPRMAQEPVCAHHVKG